MNKKVLISTLIVSFLISSGISNAQSISVENPLVAIQEVILQIQKQIDQLREQVALITAPSLSAVQQESPAITEETTSEANAITTTTTSSQIQATSTSVETPAVRQNYTVADINSSLPNNSSVSVISPNGGETFKKGSVQTIKWTLSVASSSEAFLTSILLQTTNGTARMTEAAIATSTLSFSGENQYSFTVPNNIPSASNYRIYVQMNQVTYLYSTEYTGSWLYPNDESDSAISIIEPDSSVTPAASASVFDSFASFFRKIFSW